MTKFQNVALGDLSDIVRGITFPTSAKRKAPGAGLTACLRTTNVQEKLDWDDLLYVSNSFIRANEQIVKVGDILVSMSNSLDLVGKCSFVGELYSPATFGAFLSVVRAKTGINPRYVFYAMRSPAFRGHIRGVASTTTNISNINSSKLAGATIPICGPKSQAAIASKIDELFSEIEEGERALEKVQKLVERYRQSVLKAAVTGELTREWREKHKGKLESGEALLARILKARREAWEHSELQKIKAKGMKPTNTDWKSKYKEPTAPDTTDLPELPNGWVWTSVDQLCFVETGATPRRGVAAYYENGSIPWVTSGAVNRPLISDAAEFITPQAIQETNAKVIPKGSLLVAMYGEGKTRGKVSELGIDAATNQACAALITKYLPVPVKEFLRLFFEKNYETLRKEAAGGVQPNLNLTIVKETVMPLPSLQELEAILNLSESLISQVSSYEQDFDRSSDQSTYLRQSILKLAFSGHLVPQEAADEPADVLLERIATERNQPKTKAAPKSTSRKKVTA